MNTIVKLALAAAAFAPLAAQAETVSVSYHPYEMATLAGQKAVLARIERSAGRACVSEGTLTQLAARKTCTSALVDQIVGKMNSPELTALRGGNTQVAAR